ncbi:formate/nitrite transporter family protein [Mesobacillus zeae]|uniref:Formate/nitrite transporter family protein n=1 Tax=Mesobacillus zeae TaxID=1917180 RepID=A0A398B6Y7_9BACI|nr:formate/nitrite transporter family protein [Mesobacillus zeae]RID85602.1 formate/nitrite transporter family protein [Mesobacillus zeae]
MDSIKIAVETAEKKSNILYLSKSQYMVRAILAGIYVGFGTMVSFRIGEGFYDVHSPATSLMSSIFFGMALILIIYGGGELFTGNTMIFTISTLKRITSVKELLINWLSCYSGNLIGAMFFASLIALSGLFGDPEKSQYLMDTASLKMHAPAIQLFFRAILCNWLVCLAVWIPYHVKGDGAKIAVTMLLVFAFVASGFEHSVANMVLFSIGLLTAHPDSITLYGAVHNLIPVTAGNIIGGGFFVGTVYVYLASLGQPVKQFKKSNMVMGAPRTEKIQSRRSGI